MPGEKQAFVYEIYTGWKIGFLPPELLFYLWQDMDSSRKAGAEKQDLPNLPILPFSKYFFNGFGSEIENFL